MASRQAIPLKTPLERKRANIPEKAVMKAHRPNIPEAAPLTASTKAAEKGRPTPPVSPREIFARRETIPPMRKADTIWAKRRIHPSRGLPSSATPTVPIKKEGPALTEKQSIRAAVSWESFFSLTREAMVLAPTG